MPAATMPIVDHVAFMVPESIRASRLMSITQPPRPEGGQLDAVLARRSLHARPLKAAPRQLCALRNRARP